MLKNYKNFELLKLDNLKRINVLSGKNNTGKTSVLEAVFMFYDRASADLTFKSSIWRGVRNIELTPSHLWQTLFHDFDLNKVIEIEVKDSGHTGLARYAHIKDALQKISTPVSNTFNNKIITSGSDNIAESLKATYLDDGVSSGETSFFIANNQINMNINHLKTSKKETTFLYSAARGNGIDDAARIGKLDIESGLGELVEYLKIIEPRLRGVSVIPSAGQTLIYGDVGLKRKIPLSSMGDGINKLLSILVTLLTTANGIVLLDEIENGIHYSYFPEIWNVIDKVSRDKKTQLFITTHSSDVLKGLSKYWSDNQDDLSKDDKDTCFIRLDEVNKVITPKYYDSSSLSAAIDRDWDVR